MYICLLVNEIHKVISSSPENGINLSNTHRAMSLQHIPPLPGNFCVYQSSLLKMPLKLYQYQSS